MVRIKFCGLTAPADMEAVNELHPDYIGFVFWKNSRRYVDPKTATGLKAMLHADILTVGVFVDEEQAVVADLLNSKVIDIAQLHGHEDGAYIASLRKLSPAPIIQAFKICRPSDLERAMASKADYILFDSGAGTGKAFDWSLLNSFDRPFFLAGGLDLENINKAIHHFHPFALDVSSGIETNGKKDKEKMAAFIAAVRKEEV